MPIFGNNVNGALEGGLSDDDMYGPFNAARVALQGNPVIGGNMVTAHAQMTGAPFGGVDVTAQIGVYDATPPLARNLWPLVATSNVFVVRAAALCRWYMTPIAGPLIAGRSYCAAVIGNNNDASNALVRYRNVVPAEGAVRTWIVPGVFPNPLGGCIATGMEWCIYVTYVVGDGDGCPTAACCCMPNGHSNMN